VSNHGEGRIDHVSGFGSFLLVQNISECREPDEEKNQSARQDDASHKGEFVTDFHVIQDHSSSTPLPDAPGRGTMFR
jgi:hypothetical protein